VTAGPVCPLPLSEYPNVLLAHGGGGRLSHQLIERMFASAFGTDTSHDGARIELDGQVAMSTDSFVVQPLFFPGGNIGSLAIHGTVNDLAMCGAVPAYLSVGFILEEGLPMDDLWRIVTSMQAAANDVPVRIVTGDTKVVERGKGDGVFINTTGVGALRPGVDIRPTRAAPGDVVLLSGEIGLHGIAIMSVRESLGFETALESDSASLVGLVDALLADTPDAVHVLRDPTRGGVASALNEIAMAAGIGVDLDGPSIPAPDAVRSACEILGFDPLYVANEGKCVAIVARDHADRLLASMRAHPLGGHAARIGEVTDQHPGKVVLDSGIGGARVVEMLSGEQLPRIC